MNLYLYLLIGFFISLVSYAIFTVIKFSVKRKLSKEKKAYLNKLFKQISKKHSSKEKIIDYDKLYHQILLDLNYIGTFGEILKDEPNEIGNLNKVWELHKLRNKLVHDFDLLEDSFLKRKEDEYKKEIMFLLK